MGSSKILILDPYTTMAEGKKSIKDKFIKPLLALFKGKKKEKNKNNKEDDAKVKEDTTSHQQHKTDNEVTPFDNLLKRLEQIDNEKRRILEEHSVFTLDHDDRDSDSELAEDLNKLAIEKKDGEEDEESENFSTIILPADKKTKIDSQTSEDSGYAEKCSVSDDENAEKVVKEDALKPKKLQKGYLKRAPIKSKRTPHYSDTEPYSLDNHNQIKQINTQTLSGGQVIINKEQYQTHEPIGLPEQLTENYRKQITEMLTPKEWETCSNIVQDMIRKENESKQTEHFYDPMLSGYSPNDFTNDDMNLGFYDEVFPTRLPLTPPSSVKSPCLNSPSYTTTSMSSPGTSPRSLNSEGEHFGVITHHEQYNQDILDSPQPTFKNLKQYKDHQKQLMKEFSKKECCQLILKPCKEVFRQQLEKLDAETRKGLALSVASFDLRSAYDYLKHALIDLSKSNDSEDRTVALFSHICERVLSAQKNFFVEDFGLDLLKTAVLGCPHRPVITRYLVQCIRAVTRSEAYRPTGNIVFSEVDSNNDNLLIACVRKGDDYANVLREVLRQESNDIPLFDIEHVNTDGYTALHVCCAEHGASTPRAHTLHVLLEHGNADRKVQDRKGRETPLHLAVNSAKCDLDFILLYLHDNDRTERYNLVHIMNGSGKTPLEYAKFAYQLRSKTYPVEILDFLKRCRK